MRKKLPTFLVILLCLSACIPVKRTPASASAGKYDFDKLSNNKNKEYAFMFRDFQKKERFSEFLKYKYNLKTTKPKDTFR